MSEHPEPIEASSPPGPVPVVLPRRRRSARHWVLVLLLIPFIALLWPDFYAGREPRLWGIPFFIWYQFLWIFIAVLITGVVYAADRDEPA